MRNTFFFGCGNFLAPTHRRNYSEEDLFMRFNTTHNSFLIDHFWLFSPSSNFFLGFFFFRC